MTYRALPEPPDGEWAWFLDRQRRLHDWSQTQAFEALREGLGYAPKSRSAFLPLLTGKRQPTTNEALYLTTRFDGGPTAEDRPPPPVKSESDLVAALNAQTAVIAALVEELRKVALGNLSLAKNVATVVGHLEETHGPLADQIATPSEGPTGRPRLAHPASPGTK